jgi:hypothetical protein
MNIFVHLLIARSVRRIVYEQTGARLSFTGFLYGNILPDISSEYCEMPHFLKNSLGFVIDSAARLKQDSFGDEEIGSYVYSREAGVITHYLSDFFCYAHSEQYTASIYRHHLYEFLMLFLFRRGLLLFKKQKNEQNFTVDDLKTYIQNNVRIYNHEERLTKYDICFAINVSAAVTISLLSENMCSVANVAYAAN